MTDGPGLRKLTVLFCLLIILLASGNMAAQVFPDFRFRVEDDGGIYLLVPDEDGTYLDLLDPGTQSPSRFELVANQHPETLSVMKPDPDEAAKPGLVKIFGTANIRMRIFMGDASAKGLPLSVEIQNVSPGALNVSFSVLLNTVLGEASEVHFQLLDSSASKDLGSEMSLDAESGLKVLVSGQDTRPGHLLAIPFQSPDQGIDLARTIFCANMFRLAGSEGPYQFVSGRNFSYLPFSVNDSGLRLEYPESVLLPGQSRYCSLVLAWAVPGNDEALMLFSSARVFAGQDSKKIVAPAASGKKNLSERLAELNALIKRLDEITHHKNYNQAELERIMERLQEIESQNQETPH